MLRFDMHREKIICRIPRSKPTLDSKMESINYVFSIFLTENTDHMY